MRILHTSDWHLGRSFHGAGMLAHQAAYVDHLVEVVATEQVDLVVVSGDVYDRALPPVDAVALAQDAFERLAFSRARVVITSGNHDSARRLGFGSRLIDAAGLHLRTDPDRVGEPVLLEDEHGSVAVYGVPYLEPELLRSRWSLPHRSHQAALGEAMRRVRQDLAGRRARSVVMAHAFVAGAQRSDSERDISVGGVEAVGVDTFDGVDYVALGHLHGRHVLAEGMRYSGSPLAYSFSEAGHTKGSWLVDLGADGVSGTEFVEAPVPRALATLRGTLEELLTVAEHGPAESSYVQATLTDTTRPVGAWDRLVGRFPHLRSLRFDPVGGGERPRLAPAPGRTDHETVLDFVTSVRGEAPSPAEAEVLRLAVDACPHDDEQDPIRELGA